MKNNKRKIFVPLCLRGKGFTLLEMVVAIGLLAIVVFFASAIFKAAIGSYRTASAQAEIMGKLRVITQQLDNDFRGIRSDAPVIIRFEVPSDSDDRFDQIMFFADGDFQSTRLYSGSPAVPSPTGSPVVGNVARIQYGQASLYSPTDGYFLDPNQQVFENSTDRYSNKKYRTLARRQHILTADPSIVQWPLDFISTFDSAGNDAYEHDTNSLSQWQALLQLTANQDHITDICFHYRPRINYQNSTGLHMLMAEGVPNFMVQLAVAVDDVNGVIDWRPDNDEVRTSAPMGLFWPPAIKFTFTLYDSRGVFKDGQTFTHIVYLGE
ncbi:MAG: prepilin-type N-terminal cleavage/methylation domain-containing protein [Sedimentisphaerales bacterium]